MNRSHEKEAQARGVERARRDEHRRTLADVRRLIDAAEPLSAEMSVKQVFSELRAALARPTP